MCEVLFHIRRDRFQCIIDFEKILPVNKQKIIHGDINDEFISFLLLIVIFSLMN